MRRALWELRAPRLGDVASLPNKPMHPTRIRLALISNDACGRVIGGVRTASGQEGESQGVCRVCRGGADWMLISIGGLTSG